MGIALRPRYPKHSPTVHTGDVLPGEGRPLYATTLNMQPEINLYALEKYKKLPPGLGSQQVPRASFGFSALAGESGNYRNSPLAEMFLVT